ncbi:MAG TPA: hypothetical protein VNN21_11985 [Dehalococcoidia bacterium]|nr:hypothetical protein [Dehalococcoidia bacterium]
MTENQSDANPAEKEDEEPVGEPRPSLAERLMGMASVDRPTSEMRPVAGSGERSLAERLMNAAPAGTGSRPQPSQASPPPQAAASPPPPPEPPPARPADSRVAAPRPNVRLTPPVLDGTLDEAHHYIRLRYYVFLGSVLLVFLLAVFGAIAFLVALAGDADWKKLAIIGGMETLAIAFLIFLQYRPARSFGSAATQVAKLEATRAQLNKSFEFWERFLNERQETRPLTAQEVAMAVASLTEASNGLFDVETGLGQAAEGAQKRGKEAGAAPQARAPAAPNPRRY